MATSVRCALRVVGARKIGTAFETASTPVRAVQPLAKARRTSHIESDSVAGGSVAGGTTAAGCPPAATIFAMPTVSRMAMQARNR